MIIMCSRSGKMGSLIRSFTELNALLQITKATQANAAQSRCQTVNFYLLIVLLTILFAILVDLFGLIKTALWTQLLSPFSSSISELVNGAPEHEIKNVDQVKIVENDLITIEGTFISPLIGWTQEEARSEIGDKRWKRRYCASV